MLADAISNCQCAFIRGRQSLDCSLIENEYIDSYISENKKEIICQLDLEKTYDNVNWAFLDFVIKSMGLDLNGESGLKYVFPQLPIQCR